MALEICSADKVQILGPVCSRLFSLYVVSGHMATIWADPGMSEHRGWLVFWDPQGSLFLLQKGTRGISNGS